MEDDQRVSPSTPPSSPAPCWRQFIVFPYPHQTVDGWMAGAVKGELEVGEDRVGDVPGPPQVAGYQPVGLHLHLLIYHHYPPLPVPALQLLHNHVGVVPIEAYTVQLVIVIVAREVVMLVRN